MSTPTLVIMAAGIGNRYGGLKQTEEVGLRGERLIDYSVYDALRAGFSRIGFIIREEFEHDFREKISKNFEKRVDTMYIFQNLDINIPSQLQISHNRIKPWGTAHALIVCKDVIQGPFAVINADDFYGSSSYKILYDYLTNPDCKENSNEYCTVAYVLKNTVSDFGYVTRGICEVTEDCFLKEIRELKVQKFNDAIKYMNKKNSWLTIPKESIVSMNMWGFTPKIFNELEKRFISFLEKNAENVDSEYLIPEVIGNLIKEDKACVKVLRTEEKWFGLTYKKDKPLVEQNIQELVEKKIYPKNLWG